MHSLRVKTTRNSVHIDAAAQIWAEAISAREQETEIAPLSVVRPRIEQVLRLPRSLLLVALNADRTVAFAALEPDEQLATRGRLRYFAVSPRDWSRGIGRELLRQVPELLRPAGFQEARLSVYVANTRAVSLYERCGWTAHGAPAPHAKTGKPEQQYRLLLGT